MRTEIKQQPTILLGSLAGVTAAIANHDSYHSADITVPAAVMGDFVDAACMQDIQGLIMTAHVVSPGVCHVHLHNGTGGPVTLTNVTFRVRIRR